MSDDKRSIIKCKYIFSGIYELPENIHSLHDLDNNPKIVSWGIKWGILHIHWKNEMHTSIEPSIPITQTNNCKYPSDKPSDYVFETLCDSDSDSHSNSNSNSNSHSHSHSHSDSE